MRFFTSSVSRLFPGLRHGGGRPGRQKTAVAETGGVMTEKTWKKTELLQQLETVYASRACPALFVRKNLSPFYFNAAAMLYYPSLCKDGLSPFVSSESFSENGLILLKGNARSPFPEYVLCPLSLRDAGVFRVQLLTDPAANRRWKEIFRQDFFLNESCKTAFRDIRKLSSALSRMKKGGSDVATAEKLVASLKQTVSELQRRISDDVPQRETCFDPCLLLKTAEDRISDFIVSDRSQTRLTVFCDPLLFLRSVLLAARYLMSCSSCKGKLFCELSDQEGQVSVAVSRSASESPSLVPDAVLSLCEQTALDGGGNVTMSVSEEKITIGLLFEGHYYDPAAFTLSGDDFFDLLYRCDDLLTEDFCRHSNC